MMTHSAKATTQEKEQGVGLQKILKEDGWNTLPTMKTVNVRKSFLDILKSQIWQTASLKSFY